MKILTIRLKNLASIEGTFEIDFQAEPLRSAGIFAISGPTGAGKSTILDALCLALYDKTAREAFPFLNQYRVKFIFNAINLNSLPSFQREDLVIH